MSQNNERLRIVRKNPLAAPSPSDDSLPEEFYPLLGQEVTIEHEPNNDGNLRHLTVSRYHARFIQVMDEWAFSNRTIRNKIWMHEQLIPNLGSLPVVPQGTTHVGNTVLQSYVKRGDIPFMLPQGRGRQMLMACVGCIIFGAGIIATLFICAGISAPSLVQHGLLDLLLALILPLIPAACIVVITKYIDQFLSKPSRLWLVALLWGGVIAFPLAFILEQAGDPFLHMHQSTGFLFILEGIEGGIIEETTKGLGLILLLLFFHEEVNTLTDGIIYGALIGTGFALVENFCYFATYPSFLASLIVGRIVLGGLNHATFTACFGGALGYAHQMQGRWKQGAPPLAGYAVAIGLHSIFDIPILLVSMLTEHLTNDKRIVVLTAVALLANYIPIFFAQGTLGLVFLQALRRKGAASEGRGQSL